MRNPLKSLSLRRQSGFTLVELSIVLVILGLLVGGVLAGQSLIHAAELRSIGRDLTNFNTAVYAFRDKYFALPGDLSNATSFWGSQSNAFTAGTGTQTWNGNGDGRIHSRGDNSVFYETFSAWKQLANAGLIEGNYTGINGSAHIWHGVPGQNSPKTKIGSNAGYFFRHVGDIAPLDGSYLEGSYGTTLQIGQQTGSSGEISAFISPPDQWNIDVKLDDGKPQLGKIIAQKGFDGCDTQDLLIAAPLTEYHVERTGPVCYIIYKTGY